MIINPISFNGVSLQSTDYETSIPEEQALAQLEANLMYTRRTGAFPLYAGKDLQAVTITLQVKILHDYMLQLESLNTTFDVNEETPKVLIVADAQDSNRQYYVYATPRKVIGGNDQMATVYLGVDDPIWQTVTQNSQTWTVTASGQTTDVVNSGNIEAYPTFEITAVNYPAAGYIYNNFIEFIPATTDTWVNRPLELLGDTNGFGLDTAALVAGGKALSSGNDFRVYVDGAEVDRWFGGAGFNTTDTKCWINIDQPPLVTMTLKTAIDSTSPSTSVEFVFLYADRDEFRDIMKETGRFKIDNEEFAYSSRTITSNTIIADGVSRAQRNTTAGAHAANATVTWIPYDINILYGSTAADTPDIDNTRQPILSLATSKNESFVYTVFQDEAALRSGIFTTIGSGTGDQYVTVNEPSLSDLVFYTGVNDGGDTDPADVLGFRVFAWNASGVWQAGSVYAYWRGFFPDVISSVTYTYERYQYTSNSFTMRTRFSPNGSAYYDGRTFSILTTTDLQTWKTGTDATSDVTVVSGAKYIIFQATGSLTAVANNVVKFGITSLTVNLTNRPTVTRRGEQSNYTSIFNISTGGFTLTIKTIFHVGDVIIVDTDPNFPTAKLNGQFINSIININTVRPDWLPLAVGTNTLTATADNMGEVSIAIKWRDRLNYF